jgi:hypothetical protein
VGFGTQWNRSALRRASNCLRTWWPGTELNRRRQPFQGCLPSRLSRCNHMRAQRLHRLRIRMVWASLGRFRMLDVSVLCPRSKRPPGAREYLPPANLPVVPACSDCVTQPRGSSTKASNGESLPICALRRSLLSTSSRPSQIRFRPSTLSPVNTRSSFGGSRFRLWSVGGHLHLAAECPTAV